MASAPYLGEIRMFGGKTAPEGWAFCTGVLLAISPNTALFSLIGTNFGGDGVNTFALPDLQGRVFVSADNNEYSVGQTGGEEQVNLLAPNLPAHSHSVSCSANGGGDTPKGNTWGPATQSVYSPPESGILAKAMSTLGVKPTGDGKPHDNMIPFLCVNYIIALAGIFPSRQEEEGAAGATAAGTGATTGIGAGTAAGTGAGIGAGTTAAAGAGAGSTPDQAGSKAGAGTTTAAAAGVGIGAGTTAAAEGGAVTGDQYVSELRIFPFSFVPRGWMACNGQQLPVGPNQALYSLLGNIYGGNASVFNLPNLVARVPVHAGQARTIGETGGEATHVLTINEMPAHNHQMQASSSGPAVGLPTNAFWATNTGVKPYGLPAGPLMASQAINPEGGNVGHENRSPFVVLNVCISITGIYPTKN